MTDHFIETPAEATHDRQQIIAAVLLGIGAVLTAVAAYNAALSDGEALEGYSNSSVLLSDANAFYGQSNVISAADQAVFIQYTVAAEEGRVELADYLRTLMRPELQAALDWWNASDEAVTPFDAVDGNPYVIPDLAQAQQLETEAHDAFQARADADEQGDRFELATVLFALTLFFGGIATLFAKRSVTTALLAVAALALLVGAGRLITAF